MIVDFRYNQGSLAHKKSLRPKILKITPRFMRNFKVRVMTIKTIIIYIKTRFEAKL